MDTAAKIMEQPYWYHRIELPDGNITPGWSPIEPAKYAIESSTSGPGTATGHGNR
jgi:hypothetical protein